MNEQHRGDDSGTGTNVASERKQPGPAENTATPSVTAANGGARGDGTSADAGRIEREHLAQAAQAGLQSLASFGSSISASASESLREARRFVRLRYFSFLGVLLIVAATLAVSVITLAVFLLSESSWQEKAGSAVVAGAALVLLIVLQYRPASTYSSAAIELAQLEAMRMHLEKSYGAWDEYLKSRERVREVTASEFATAVASMTSTTREMVALQAELLQTKKATRTGQSARPGFPTPTMPDPRRY